MGNDQNNKPHRKPAENLIFFNWTALFTIPNEIMMAIIKNAFTLAEPLVK